LIAVRPYRGRIEFQVEARMARARLEILIYSRRNNFPRYAAELARRLQGLGWRRTGALWLHRTPDPPGWTIVARIRRYGAGSQPAASPF